MLDERLQQLASLYVLDALDPDERSGFETEIGSNAELRAEIRDLAHVTRGLLDTVPQVEPPVGLRGRVLAAATGAVPRGAARGGEAQVVERVPETPPAARFAWIAAAASLVLAIGLGSYALQLRREVTALGASLSEASARLTVAESRVARMQQAVTEAEVRTAVLAAPDLAQVLLSGQAPAPAARARAFWSRSRGLVFTASALPGLPPGRTYQLWVVTADTPISAGLLQPDAEGQVLAWFDTPPDLPAPVAMAVTLEPEGGVPQPTGAMYLLGNVGP
jgi:anti-sigma-K factor RskA